MVTIKDVAKHAGVTIGTVSRVINNKEWVSDDCRSKILLAIRNLKYKPQAHARRLRQKQSKIFGVIAPHHTSVFRSPFFTNIMEGIEEVAAEKRYRLLFHPLNEITRAQLAYRILLGDGSVDGMFVLNAWSTDISIRELTEASVPFVLIGGKVMGHEELPYVGFDNRGGVKKAVEYLRNLGHERIAMINGRMTTTNALERFQTFQEALAEHKLGFEMDWVAEGNFEEEGGYQACRQIMEAIRKPTAILCANDTMAMGAIRALEEKSLSVPEDISVVGFDNMEDVVYHRPSLTTIAFSTREMGRLAAKKLLQITSGETLVEKATILQGELVERQSAQKVN